MSTETGRDQLDIRITGGDPTDDEVAAVTAVLSAALEELAGEQRRRPGAGPTAWQRSQRTVRHPLVRGTWREYGI